MKAAHSSNGPSSHLHLLSPAMRDVLRRMARANRPAFETLTADEARAAYQAGAGVLEIATPKLAKVHDFTITARDGCPLPARLYADSAGLLPVLLYFHGGGFTIGSVTTHDVLCRQLAKLASCAVVSLDYRLAPQHKFPTAVTDAWDSLLWLAGPQQNLGLDSRRIAVGGDSAGGTLAAVCAILARDAGLPLSLQILFYPGCAAHQDTPSHHRFAEGFVLGQAQISWFFGQYLRSAADRDDWRFSPLNVPDADGLAPAWFGLAECDPLVDEGILYADKLRHAGVSVDLEIYRGVTHEFIKMGRVIPQAKMAHADAAVALVNAFGSYAGPD